MPEGVPDRELDEIVGWVRAMTGAESAIVSLVGAERQVFAARAAFAWPGSSRDHSICAHVVAREAPLVIEDARRDPVFADHPLVTGPPHLRSYVGAPIRLSNHMVVGSLGALGTKPRPAPPSAVLARVSDLADQIAFILEARAVKDGRADAMARATDRAQRDFLALVSHELRTPLVATHALGEVGEPPQVGGDVVAALRVSGALMTRLVESVTTFSQLRSGSLLPKEVTMPARRMLEAVRAAVAPPLAAAGGTTPEIASPAGLTLRGDPALLTLALDCLANHAVSQGARSIRLSASAGRRGAILAVDARGPARAPSSDRAAPHRAGGVGLTLARRLIELHGGELTSRGARIGRRALCLPRWRVVRSARGRGA